MSWGGGVSRERGTNPGSGTADLPPFISSSIDLSTHTHTRSLYPFHALSLFLSFSLSFYLSFSLSLSLFISTHMHTLFLCHTHTPCQPPSLSILQVRAPMLLTMEPPFVFSGMAVNYRLRGATLCGVRLSRVLSFILSFYRKYYP